MRVWSVLLGQLMTLSGTERGIFSSVFSLFHWGGWDVEIRLIQERRGALCRAHPRCAFLHSHMGAGGPRNLLWLAAPRCFLVPNRALPRRMVWFSFGVWSEGLSLVRSGHVDIRKCLAISVPRLSLIFLGHNSINILVTVFFFLIWLLHKQQYGSNYYSTVLFLNIAFSC